MRADRLGQRESRGQRKAIKTQGQGNANPSHRKTPPHVPRKALKREKISMGRMAESGALLPCCWDGKWCSALGNSLADPQKVKHRVTIGPTSSTCRYTPRRRERRAHTK